VAVGVPTAFSIHYTLGEDARILPLKHTFRLVGEYYFYFQYVMAIMRLKLLWGLVAVGWTGYAQISGSPRPPDSAFLNDQKNQISEYDQMFSTIFIDNNFMGQNGGMPVICNGRLIR